jgi:hypothetical protein
MESDGKFAVLASEIQPREQLELYAHSYVRAVCQIDTSFFDYVSAAGFTTMKFSISAVPSAMAAICDFVST